jgi:hypothetical protein
MLRRFAYAALAATTILSASAIAQKKPATTYTPVTVTFRCPFEADCTGTDAISGDTAMTYRGSADGTNGPVLNSIGDLYFPLKAGSGRGLNVRIGAPLSQPACVASGTCRKTFESVFVTSMNPPSITNAQAEGGGQLPDGFRSIPVGETVNAHYKLNFPDPSGRAFLWTLRFNPNLYPGTNDLLVSRTADNVWVVEALPGHVAELVSVPTSGKQVMTHEGFYSMPFRMTVVR